jgi:hypothetical protein
MDTLRFFQEVFKEDALEFMKKYPDSTKKLFEKFNDSIIKEEIEIVD